MKKIAVTVCLVIYILLWICYWKIEFSEIWFAWKDEWILIKNKSFTWSLLISWAKNDSIVLPIYTTWNIILGDNETNTYWHTWEYFWNLWLSLSDSIEWEIQLLWSWIVMDTLLATSDNLKDAKKNNLSLKKSDLSEIAVDQSISAFTWSLEIVEILASWTNWEYVDIVALENSTWDITIEGLWYRDASKKVTVSLFSWERIRLSNQDNVGNGSMYIEWLSLTDSWEDIRILWQDWQVIDNVVYEKHAYWKWLNLIQEKDWVRYFGVKGDGNIKWLEDIYESVWCSILVQNKSVFHQGDSINLQWAFEWKQLQNWSSTYHCERDWISETEKTKCNPSSYTINDDGLHKITLQIYKDAKLCKTTVILNTPKKETPQNTKKQENMEKDNLNVSNHDVVGFEQNSYTIYPNILVTSILPNPIWSDWESEELYLIYSWNNDIDISWLVVNSWSRRRELDSIFLEWGNVVKIKWDLWLYNRKSCFTLESKDWYIFHEVCYPETKEGEWYSEISDNSLKSFKKNYFKQSPVLVSWTNNEFGDSQILAPISPPQKITLYNLLDIYSVLPNPLWSDMNNESITLQRTWTWVVDLNNLVIETLKWEKKLWTWTKITDTKFVRTGNFWLYNSASCFRLKSKNGQYIYDEFCYPKTKEWTHYWTSSNIIELSDTGWMKEVDVKIVNNQVCIVKESNIILCREEILERYQKNIDKLESKLNKKTTTSNSSIGRLKDDYDKQKTESNFNKSVLYDITSHLKKVSFSSYMQNGIQEKEVNWKETLALDNNFVFKDNIWLKNIYSIKNWKIPISTTDIDDIRKPIKSSFQWIVIQLIENLKIYK